MARWAVMFENAIGHPSRADQAHKDEHHAYLVQHRDSIRSAGAIATDQQAPFVGGLWIVEATSRAEVQTLAEGCPFYRSGVHKSFRLVWWGSAPGMASLD
jgi:uncharacterized protein YciI